MTQPGLTNNTSNKVKIIAFAVCSLLILSTYGVILAKLDIWDELYQLALEIGCLREVTQEIATSDREYVALAVGENCHSTVAFNTKVYVRESGAWLHIGTLRWGFGASNTQKVFGVNSGDVTIE